MAGIITDDVMAGLRRLADKLEGEFFISKEDVEKEIEPTVQGIMNGHVKYIRDRTEDEVRRDTIAGKIVEIAAMKKSDGGPTKRYHYDFLFESEYRVEVKRINKDVGFKYLRNDKQRLDTFINHSKAIDYFIVGDYEKANGGYNVIFDYVAIAYRFDKHYKDSQFSGPRYYNHKEAAKRKNAILLNQCTND